MMASLQNDDDISWELHLTVMKICITDNGVQDFLKAFILENMMTITASWYSCARVEVQY